MDDKEKLARYDYMVYIIKASILCMKDEIEEEDDYKRCVYLKGRLDSYKEDLYGLTGDDSIYDNQ